MEPAQLGIIIKFPIIPVTTAAMLLWGTLLPDSNRSHLMEESGYEQN